MAEWYVENPLGAMAWVREYKVQDLRDQAVEIRRQAESHARSLEAAADLIADVIDSQPNAAEIQQLIDRGRSE
jgi:hypothetical protein